MHDSKVVKLASYYWSIKIEKSSILQLIVVTQARVLCLICTPGSPRAEGGHIRQSTSDCVTTIM